MFSPKKNTYKGRAEMAEKLLASLVLKQPIQELRMQFLRRKLLPVLASKEHSLSTQKCLANFYSVIFRKA